MVAYLIYLLTKLFGSHEFTIRTIPLIAWFITAYYGYSLSESMCKNSGAYSLLILACMPFFFLFSTVMTPDPLVTACWSATLFFLNQALVKNRSTAWYKAGVALGLGLFSKYTIALLIPATGIFMLINRDARKQIFTPQPYIAILIATTLFIPVIYWNYEHEWASFAFQTTKRLNDHWHFSLHILIGLFILFATPVGVIAALNLFKNNLQNTIVNYKNLLFIQIFTIFPLSIFIVFSIMHSVKFNWIGPCLLAIVPWFAALSQKHITLNKLDFRNGWYNTAAVLCLIYTSLIFSLSTGLPAWIYRTLLPKFINWSRLAKDFNNVAVKTSDAHNGMPAVFISMDSYNTNSELAYYQNSLFELQQIAIKFPISGNHIFGLNDLMYKYWEIPNIAQHPVVIISTNKDDLTFHYMLSQVSNISAVNKIWAYSAHGRHKIRPYYYLTASWRKELPSTQQY
jgi:dolichol-phosphate mannosyltransferase